MLRITSRLTAVFAGSLLALSLCGPVADAEAGARLDKIMQTKTLRVGTPGDYRPFSMHENGKITGHDIEVIEKLAREMGVKTEYVQSSWPTLAKDYADDKFDVAVGGITRTGARFAFADFLPAYAPFGKVALVRKADKDRFTSLDSLNQPNVRVIKNPGGSNEIFVDTHLTKAKVSLHPNNAEIPHMIAEGKGDVMITETNEAIIYSKMDKRLYPTFLDNPLTPVNYMGFMIQKDDPDYVRLMNFLWNLLDLRGELGQSADAWLK